jgi:hypothetical protein
MPLNQNQLEVKAVRFYHLYYYISRPQAPLSGACVAILGTSCGLCAVLAMLGTSCAFCAVLAYASGVNTMMGSDEVVVGGPPPSVGSPTGTVIMVVPLANVTVIVVFDRVGREQ